MPFDTRPVFKANDSGRRTPAAGWILALAILATTACSSPARTYPGPRRPRGEVAVVRVWGKDDALGLGGLAAEVRFDVQILGLDGRCWRPLGKIVEVTPGPHTFTLHWVRLETPGWRGRQFEDEPSTVRIPTHWGCTTLELLAGAGRTYELEWVEPWERDPPCAFREVRRGRGR